MSTMTYASNFFGIVLDKCNVADTVPTVSGQSCCLVLQACLVTGACICILCILLVPPVSARGFITTSTGSTPKAVGVSSYQPPICSLHVSHAALVPWYSGYIHKHYQAVAYSILLAVSGSIGLIAVK